ncbi:MAG TPA: hypothetical protein VE593_01790 [Nitrososphaeraceae archaeon]|nr:hypothetical protein [Nitrososphaeraceae archaeon]
MWFPFRNNKKDKSPQIYSVETCESCGYMTRRTFKLRDYVYKKSTTCDKCFGIVMITSIYGEYPSEKQDKKS